METFENRDQNPDQTTGQPNSQPEQIPQQQESAPHCSSYAYRGSGTGRKESPYANSPYVMNHPPRQEQSSGYYHQAPQQPQYEPPKKAKKVKKQRSGSFWKSAVAVMLTIALVAGGCVITAVSVNNRWEAENAKNVSQLSKQIDALQKQINSLQANVGSTVSGTSAAPGAGLTPSQVYARNVGSVVAISNQSTTNYFGQVSETASSGSGFILTEDGYVVSNYHVVSGATTLTVILHDGTEYPATLIGGDENNDIALLKVEATGLQAVTVGSSDALVVGDQVVAIGNPLGELTSTQTVGYISAKDRDITTDGVTINMMQTDAAINSGNSGGPLFNMKGEVVGITTAKYSGSSSSGASIESIGFAIPMDDVIGMIDDLVNFGYVTGAYLGVGVNDVDTAAQFYGVPAGAYAVELYPGYCAEKAGVQVGDIITAIGGQRVESYTDLSRALRKFEAGDTTQLTVYRSGQELTIELTLDEKPQTTDEPAGEAMPDQSQMPQDGSYEEWFNYFDRFFNFGR